MFCFYIVCLDTYIYLPNNRMSVECNWIFSQWRNSLPKTQPSATSADDFRQKKNDKHNSCPQDIRQLLDQKMKIISNCRISFYNNGMSQVIFYAFINSCTESKLPAMFPIYIKELKQVAGHSLAAIRSSRTMNINPVNLTWSYWMCQRTLFHFLIFTGNPGLKLT